MSVTIGARFEVNRAAVGISRSFGAVAGEIAVDFPDAGFFVRAVLAFNVYCAAAGRASRAVVFAFSRVSGRSFVAGEVCGKIIDISAFIDRKSAAVGGCFGIVVVFRRHVQTVV